MHYVCNLRTSMMHSDTVVKNEQTSFCLLNNCMQRIFSSLTLCLSIQFGSFARSGAHAHSQHNEVLLALWRWHHDHVLQGNSSICSNQKLLECPFFSFAFCVAIKSCVFVCKFSFNTCCTLAASICTYRSSERILLWWLSHAPACSGYSQLNS